jgi:hypothetical protein
MARFNRVPQLSQEDARTLSELLFRAESIDKVLRFNTPRVEDHAKRLGIRPSEELKRFLGTPNDGLCQSLAR